MAPISIVSGCPGSGKTTLSHALARAVPNGLHLVSDRFYEFPAEPIDPTRTESKHQNTVIMRALAASARAFAEGGYHVVLDGVIGPWFLPQLRDELADFERLSYVVLRVPEPTALERVRKREGPGASAAVRHMVAAFSDLGDLRSHGVDTDERTPAEILEVVLDGLNNLRFQLPHSNVYSNDDGVV
jgi:predicted kinase